MPEDPTAVRTLHQRILDLSDRVAAHARLIREATNQKRLINNELIEENRRLIEELNWVVKELSEATNASDQWRSAKGNTGG